MKCVSPLNPSPPSWQLLNLKGSLCSPGTKAHRVTCSPTGTDWRREKERRKRRRKETAKIVELGGRRETQEKNDEKRLMTE